MSASLAEQLAAMRAVVSEAEFEAAMADMGEDDWESLAHDWGFWGRPEQQLPDVPWTHWLVLAGRGFGKTRTGAEAVRAIVASGEVQHVGFVAKTPADARDVMIEGPAGILAVSPDAERPTWEPSKRRLTWPNGATATVFSGETPDQLRGPQHQLVWVDELCAFQYPEETWDNLALGLRIAWKSGGPARSIITTTPRPLKTLRAIMATAGTVVTRGSTYDNRSNLDQGFLSQILAVYEGTRLGRQELYAELLEDVQGALWTPAMLDGCRRPNYPELPRLVVAVDPAMTSGDGSAETGIVVVGAGIDGHGYVLEDLSCRMSPLGWAKRAVEAYWAWKADEIVVESNAGGEMLTTTIATVDPRVPVKTVNASRGKRVRAEPVAALYEQGRMHHVGMFPQLEDQMVNYTGRAGEVSPDRHDALVWGVTRVMLLERETVANVGFA